MTLLDNVNQRYVIYMVRDTSLQLPGRTIM